MCFNIAQSKKLKDLAKRYGVKTNVVEMAEEILREQKQHEDGKKVKTVAVEQYLVPAFLKPECPVITPDGQIKLMRWGMIPHNANISDIQKIDKGNWYVNARSEQVFDTYPYKMSITNSRCIIPVTGFFEHHYHHPRGKSWLYYIYLQNQEIFSIGGIYSQWKNLETGNTLNSFSLLTTAANPLMYRIHNGGKNPHRMPLILNRNDEMKWIEPTLTKNEIENMMKVYPDDEMATCPLRSDYKEYSLSDAMILENTTMQKPLKVGDFQR